MKNVEKENNFNNLQSDNSGSMEDSIFNTVFNSNQAIMLLVDPENNQKILDANEAALQFYGYTREHFFQLTMGDLNSKSEAEQNRLMGEGVNKPYSHLNFIHKTSSGLFKDVEVDTSPFVYKNKKAMFVIVHDITALKTIEAALKESEERFELALAGTELGLWDLWVQTDEFHVNERWAEIFGYTLEELSPISNNTWRENSHPEDVKEADRLLQKYLRKEIDSYACEMRMRHKDGSWVWVYTKGKVSKWSEDGKPIRISGTHLDITEEKSIELKLADSEGKYRSYFESSPLSLWEEDYTDVISYLDELSESGITEFRNYFDAHPEIINKCVSMIKVIDVNQATLRLFDAQSKEDLFWNLESVFTEDSFEFFKDEIISIYNNEPLLFSESTNKTLNGRVIDIKFEAVQLSENRFLITITDITELKKKELELKELLFQTKADAETKEILLREINHRVKNNLSSFIGMLYAEKKQSGRELTEAQLAHVDSLINRVKGISIAHDLLSRSKWAPISLFSLSEKIVHSLNHLIPAGRSIRTEITNSSVFLDADQSHSMAVVINELFTNCIEHASHEGGELEVKIKIIEKKGKITYIYSDTGPGFSKKVLNSESYNVGLYLINNIVEQSLRGTVRLKNRGGAMVIIDFPGGVEFEEL